MKIPRYWAKGRPAEELADRNPRTGAFGDGFACWGWSDVSREDAARVGAERAEAVAAMIRSGKRPDRYLYSDKPMREEVVDEWQEAGSIHAATTINSYGCLVLNVADVMFVDVDLPEEAVGTGLGPAVRRLFGTKPRKQDAEQEAAALRKVEELVDRSPQCGVRVYRTRAGLRYLMTHGLANPASDSTIQTMNLLGADPLYVQLCKVQECFRARLTPKPWRCGTRAMSAKYPRMDEAAEEKARKWMQTYRRKAEPFATCQFVKHYGSTRYHDGIVGIVELHDKLSRAESGLALA